MTDLLQSIESRRRRRRYAVLACAGALALGLGACGGDDGGDDDTPAPPANAEASQASLPSDDQKKGGTLKFLAAEQFSHLDPGQSYFQLDYMVAFAVHRSLYYYEPDNSGEPIPDIADGDPEVSADNMEVTVKLKEGIKYGTVKDSPIKGQEVKAADVKYAFERALNPTVANGYFATYFSSIEGSEDAKGGPISGITTPDDQTIVFKLTKPLGATVAKALVMPITMPVPKSHAEKYDAKQPNTYDTDPTVQAFTGPYMISEFSSGKGLTLVRNPEWDADSDSRPAYLDQIDWVSNADPNVAGRQIFNGNNLANGDTPVPGTVRRFQTQDKKRISFSAAGNRWASLNYTKKPFSDVNVRKAAIAIMDRRALQLTRGGPVAGDIATHFLPPSMAGFEEAGGRQGTGADYLANPQGDPAVAAKYMKEAGYASGKADGEEIVMVSSVESPAKESAAVMRDSLEKLGFTVKQRSYDHAVMYSKYCNVEEQLKKIDVCSNYGWLPDFADPYAMLNANFNGEAIVEVNNSNPSLFNDPEVNAAMNEGAQIADPGERAGAWGAIDKQLVEKAAAIPWFWDKQPNVVGKNVKGVIAQWNATWDLSYMSIL